jgi:hypothetical protein
VSPLEHDGSHPVHRFVSNVRVIDLIVRVLVRHRYHSRCGGIYGRRSPIPGRTSQGLSSFPAAAPSIAGPRVNLRSDADELADAIPIINRSIDPYSDSSRFALTPAGIDPVRRLLAVVGSRRRSRLQRADDRIAARAQDTQHHQQVRPFRRCCAGSSRRRGECHHEADGEGAGPSATPVAGSGPRWISSRVGRIHLFIGVFVPRDGVPTDQGRRSSVVADMRLISDTFAALTFSSRAISRARSTGDAAVGGDGGPAE